MYSVHVSVCILCFLFVWCFFFRSLAIASLLESSSCTHHDFTDGQWEHIMISLWQTSSNINFKFTTQAHNVERRISKYMDTNTVHTAVIPSLHVAGPFKTKRALVFIWVFFPFVRSFVIVCWVLVVVVVVVAVSIRGGPLYCTMHA